MKFSEEFEGNSPNPIKSYIEYFEIYLFIRYDNTLPIILVKNGEDTVNYSCDCIVLLIL